MEVKYNYYTGSPSTNVHVELKYDNSAEALVLYMNDVQVAFFDDDGLCLLNGLEGLPMDLLDSKRRLKVSGGGD